MSDSWLAPIVLVLLIVAIKAFVWVLARVLPDGRVKLWLLKDRSWFGRRQR